MKNSILVLSLSFFLSSAKAQQRSPCPIHENCRTPHNIYDEYGNLDATRTAGLTLWIGFTKRLERIEWENKHLTKKQLAARDAKRRIESAKQRELEEKWYENYKKGKAVELAEAQAAERAADEERTKLEAERKNNELKEMERREALLKRVEEQRKETARMQQIAAAETEKEFQKIREDRAKENAIEMDRRFKRDSLAKVEFDRREKINNKWYVRLLDFFGFKNR